MKKSDWMLLQKILGEISCLEEIVSDSSLEKFLADWKEQKAATMTLINIGEKANKLSTDIKSASRDIPYQKIISMRNLAAHEYDVLRFGQVWELLTVEIPVLKNKIERLLGEKD